MAIPVFPKAEKRKESTKQCFDLTLQAGYCGIFYFNEYHDNTMQVKTQFFLILCYIEGIIESIKVLGFLPSLVLER